jgi:hypothetical protein
VEHQLQPLKEEEVAEELFPCLHLLGPQEAYFLLTTPPVLHTTEKDLDPPLGGAMDLFKSALPRLNLQANILIYDKLNDKILDTKDLIHHVYVMMSRTDTKIILVHRLSFHSAPLRVRNEPWHQKLFALTGDVVGSQMPQMVQLPTQALDVLSHAVKVAKLAVQLATLEANSDTEMLEPVATGADPATFDELKMWYSMYVPGKYLPLLLARHMTPKEALLIINTKAVSERTE